MSSKPPNESDTGPTGESANSLIPQIRQALYAVHDPEIPPLSIVEMGMIHTVEIENGAVRVSFMPTFAGCPALLAIQNDIEASIRGLALPGVRDVIVNAVFDPPWSTDRITDEGRRKLKEFGLAPPIRLHGQPLDPSAFVQVPCPFCGSRATRMESPFGPTLCRAIHYCDACRQSFEQFKPVELVVLNSRAT